VTFARRLAILVTSWLKDQHNGKKVLQVWKHISPYQILSTSKRHCHIVSNSTNILQSNLSEAVSIRNQLIVTISLEKGIVDDIYVLCDSGFNFTAMRAEYIKPEQYINELKKPVSEGLHETDISEYQNMDRK